MIDNEGIPPKEDSTAIATAAVVNIIKSQSNIAINQPSENPATQSTSSTEPETNSQGKFKSQFQQKTKMLRNAWSEKNWKVHVDNWQLLAVILLTICGVACNITAIVSNYWTCDVNTNFGLWDTCYEPINDGPIWPTVQNDTLRNASVISEPVQTIKCAKQGLRWIIIEQADQSRINRVYAAQWLLVVGCVLYAFSLLTICLSYRFVQSNNMNSLRSSLICSVAVQFIAFFLMLIGFYLFILTEQISISIGLLFVYFGLAMFASNTINFISVEYKTHKAKSCATDCE